MGINSGSVLRSGGGARLTNCGGPLKIGPLQSEGARLARSTLRMVWESILALRPNVRFCSGSKSAKRQRRWHSGRELQRFAFTKAVLRIGLAPFSHSSPVVDIFDSRNYCWFPENVALAP